MTGIAVRGPPLSPSIWRGMLPEPQLRLEVQVVEKTSHQRDGRIACIGIR